MKLDRQFWLKLFFESALIVFSVLLALTVNEYLAARKEDKRTRESLLSIREELRANQEIIRGWQEIHREALGKIEKYRAQPTSYDSLVQNHQFRLDLLFEGTLVPNVVRSNSWEIAKNSGLLQNFDIALANSLSDIYDMQKIVTSVTVDKLISIIFDRQTHLQQNIPQTMVLFEFTMQELVGQENYLIEAYDQILKKLDTALEE